MDDSNNFGNTSNNHINYISKNNNISRIISITSVDYETACCCFFCFSSSYSIPRQITNLKFNPPIFWTALARDLRWVYLSSVHSLGPFVKLPLPRHCSSEPFRGLARVPLRPRKGGRASLRDIRVTLTRTHARSYTCTYLSRLICSDIQTHGWIQSSVNTQTLNNKVKHIQISTHISKTWERERERGDRKQKEKRKKNEVLILTCY